MRITHEGRQELGRTVARYLKYEISTDDIVIKVSELFLVEYPNAGPSWTNWTKKFEELIDALIDLNDHEYAPGKFTRVKLAFKDVTYHLALNFGGKEEDYIIP